MQRHSGKYSSGSGSSNAKSLDSATGTLFMAPPKNLSLFDMRSERATVRGQIADYNNVYLARATRNRA